MSKAEDAHRSALHKSMRNSDCGAAVYWLAWMLESGEDPLYIARRIIRFASEDIGMADLRALEVAVAAYSAAHSIGVQCLPENLKDRQYYLPSHEGFEKKVKDGHK